MIPKGPWTEKYSPRKLDEIVGQNKAIEKLKHFVENFKSQKKKALFLHGPIGTGKTSSVFALANELDMEIIEINASDFRTADEINKIVGSSSQQMSLFMKKKIILIDEIDGLSGHKDRGGIAAVTKLISKSKFPIIITANNPYDKKLSSLRKLADMQEFQTLNYISIVKHLKRIVNEEKLDIDESKLKNIGRCAGGDLRGAVTDMQQLASTTDFSRGSVDSLGERGQQESMPAALIKVLKNSNVNIAVQAFDNVEEDIDKQILWVDYNMPKEYTKPEDLARAYEAISKADMFKKRISRQQYWRYLVYVNAFLTAGVARAKEEKYKGFTQYKPTSRILKIWQANMKFQKRKAIAQKIAEKTHCSSYEVLNSTLPYLQLLFKKNASYAKDMAEEFEFNNEEVAWLKK